MIELQNGKLPTGWVSIQKMVVIAQELQEATQPETHLKFDMGTLTPQEVLNAEKYRKGDFLIALDIISIEQNYWHAAPDGKQPTVIRYQGQEYIPYALQDSAAGPSDMFLPVVLMPRKAKTPE
ncbi:hypothetical protein [Deinococcus cellulosilyticus]|uniref:Uncharacterized protein n=1 Tax=Deinococcus cellulosilyticus (strain DSM 18568 / NBRC 106333 / KACC 11606 / 5516J-15) TaxID=1223518 RepID=A0A511N881_DEIC1|nr:hypothetical protein [Deinococcus cellulosilyticus]GEM48686.1 hypothetical protein DC3_43210 [Deinococcus cellulosilyticus NBRC 106333 = KACC 11606]